MNSEMTMVVEEEEEEEKVPAMVEEKERVRIKLIFFKNKKFRANYIVTCYEREEIEGVGSN